MLLDMQDIRTASCLSYFQRIADFDTQRLGNTARVFSTVGFPQAELFAVSAKAAEPRINKFQCTENRQQSWGIYDGGLPMRTSVCAVGQGSRAVYRGFRHAKTRQHSVGAFDGGLPTGRAARCRPRQPSGVLIHFNAHQDVRMAH